MDKIKGLFNNLLVVAAVSFIVGLFIGLVVLGWGLFPVQWTDGAPADLRQDFQKDYLHMTIDSYAKTQYVDKTSALKRWGDLGKNGQALLAEIQKDPTINPQDVLMFSQLVNISYTGPGQATQAITPGIGETLPAGVITTPIPGSTMIPIVSTVASGSEPALNLFGNLPVVIGLFCVLALIIGASLVYILFFRKNNMSIAPQKPTPAATRPVTEMPQVDVNNVNISSEPSVDNPIVQFMTTYMLGDDLYDDSFSIDSVTGEFLGECGMGIAETIGVGDPKKVTAFEVWLFDKNDIQTITKVFMSQHAFNDPSIIQKLAHKGEPVLVEPGKHIALETATLSLEARVVDMQYGQGALPSQSYYERLTIELAIWQKQV